MATPSEDDQIEGLAKGQQIASCMKLKEFCGKYHLTEDIWPLFVENFVYYDLLFNLNDQELYHLLKNEWNLSFLKIKRIETAITSEKQEMNKKESDKIKQLQSQIAQLNIANMAKITQISDLQSLNDQKTLEITSLKREIDQLKSNINENIETITKMETNEKEFEKKIKFFQTKCDMLTLKLKESEATNDYLQTLCNKQTKDIAFLQNENNTNDKKSKNKSDKNNEELTKENKNNNNNNNNNNKKNKLECDCGMKLVKMELASAYGTTHVQCCQCFEWVNGINKPIYHCPNGYCYQHPNGYDLCLKCLNLKKDTI